MKRTLILLLCACMIFCVTSCNSSESSDSAAKIEKDHVHDYTDATCTKPKTCECGDTAGKDLGHNFEVATCTSPKICKRCGMTEGEPLGHDYVKATCISPKFCKRCDTVTDNELGHDFVDGKCTRCEKYDRVYLIDDIDYLEKSRIEYTQERITDNQSNEHFGNYIFTTEGTFYDGNISFQLDKKYKNFYGTSFISYNARGNNGEAYIKVYGDEKLLFQTKEMEIGYIPETFNVDVTGVSVLKIYFEPYSSMNEDTYAYLTDAYLVK